MSSSEIYPKKKLVICLSRFPYPIEKGDKLRAYYQIIDLSEYFEIYLLCTSNKAIKEAELSKLQSYCKEIHIFKLNPIIQIFQLMRTLFTRKPFQVAYFTQQGIKNKINLLLERIHPQHIYCQLIRPAEYVKNYHNCTKTIDLMDALSKGMERRIENAPRLLKFLFREENKRLLDYERKILNYFESATIISHQDREFILHPSYERIAIVPNGVDSEYFKSFEKQVQPQYDLVFIGNMNYPPNVEAARYIVEEMLPRLQKKFPTISCLISGANPSKTVQNLKSEAVTVTGWVDDIRLSYQSAKIFIAPMRSGTGMQNKLLEAMAMGLPCITTTLANNAILAEPGEDILIADDTENMCKQVETLLQNPELYQKIASGGNKLVKERYNWKHINAVLAKILGEG